MYISVEYKGMEKMCDRPEVVLKYSRVFRSSQNVSYSEYHGELSGRPEGHHPEAGTFISISPGAFP